MPILTLTPAQSDALDVIGGAFRHWQDRGDRLRDLIAKYGADLPDESRHRLQALGELLTHPAIGYCHCEAVTGAKEGRCTGLAIWIHPEHGWRYCQTHAAEYFDCPGCGDVTHDGDATIRPVGGVGTLKLCTHCAEDHPDSASPIGWQEG